MVVYKFLLEIGYLYDHTFLFLWLFMSEEDIMLTFYHTCYVFKGGKRQESICYLKLHSAYLNNFFKWTRVLKHHKYVWIKQIFQSRHQTKKYFYRYFINQFFRLSMRSTPFARISCIGYIFVYTMKSVFFLISIHIFVHFNL